MCSVSILSMQFGKFQRILKSLAVSLNISSVGDGICCAYRADHMAQVVIHIAATINCVIMIMYLHYYYYYYFYQCI